MIKPIKAYMRTGMILHVLYPELGAGEGPWLEKLDTITGDEFFDVVELTHIADPGIRKTVAERIRITGMDLAFGAQGLTLGPGLTLCDTDEEGRKKAVKAVMNGIDEAAEMGCLNVQFMAGRYREEEKDRAYDQLIRSTKELCAYSDDRYGIPVLCEIFDYDVDKKALIGPAALARTYAEEVCRDYPSFGLQIDSSHFPILHETIEESVLPVKEYVKHAHMGNAVAKEGCKGYGDWHPRFGYPDSANDVNDLAEYLRTLIEIGYLSEEKPGIVTFEVRPQEGERSEDILANAKRTLARAWALV